MNPPPDADHHPWQIAQTPCPDQEWRQAVATAAGWSEPLPMVTAQLLWQRGWRDAAMLGGYLNPDRYVPTSPWALGPDMERAIARLIQAREQGEKVAIWGDFDADGLTATALLWEGLGQFFSPGEALRYYVPNRFTESHGLSEAGLAELAAWGCTLIVTCDTGSTADQELANAADLGLEVIVTDHHTLPTIRPPVVALINPRQLPPDHPLADLSGVAVAYKLLEALYERLPTVPQQPITTLLDLVAIGLIADLVTLRGDCRYLAQVGLRTLERQAKQGVRPGISKLLALCKRTGDRPSDIAFGLGPRINAVSRIHGDAHFGVELLTSRDRPQAEKLALDAEAANTRRKDLQARVLAMAEAQLAQLDLATTHVIVLADPQWSPGVLGLVASQLAQRHGRPVILLQTEVEAASGQPLMARGSARSVQGIDLYTLVKDQSHLLTKFGGHPFAAGLALPVTNLELFTAGINRALRVQQAGRALAPALVVDLEVSVAELGRALFKALKLLEPYGMGNPTPRLLLRQVCFEEVWEKALRDRQGNKQRSYRVSFTLQDIETGARFPGHGWDIRRDDLPSHPCDVVVELDVNFHKNPAVYEVRLIDWRIATATDLSWETVTATDAGGSQAPTPPLQADWIVDQRAQPPADPEPPALAQCPVTWEDFPPPQHLPRPLTLAYQVPEPIPPNNLWQQWIGLAKYLARTETACTIPDLAERLHLSPRTVIVGLQCLQMLGFGVVIVVGVAAPKGLDWSPGTIAPTTGTRQGATTLEDDLLSADAPPFQIQPRLDHPLAPDIYRQAAERFTQAVQEEQFRRRYFHQVPTQILQGVLSRPNLT
jgi:single-stranded-DNA-specific exonuclease